MVDDPPDEQRDKVDEFWSNMTRHIHNPPPNSKWYVVSKEWFAQWEIYTRTHLEEDNPGEITNRDLLSDEIPFFVAETPDDEFCYGKVIKSFMRKGHDYEIVSE